MNRRNFLAAGMAAPLGAARRIDRNRFSALTDEVGTTPAEALAFLRQYGLRWVELRAVPGTHGAPYAERPEAELKQFARELADQGLRVSQLSASLLKSSLPDISSSNDGATQRLEALRRTIEAAHILGTEKIRTFSFRRAAEPEKVWPQVAEILGEMAEVAGRARIRLMLENEASCNVATTAELAGFMKQVPSKWVGINWDPYNGLRREKRPFPDGYAQLSKKRLGNVHVKARSLFGPDTLDWKAIFGALKRDGYRGCIGLETHVGEKRIETSHASIREMIRIAEG